MEIYFPVPLHITVVPPEGGTAWQLQYLLGSAGGGGGDVDDKKDSVVLFAIYVNSTCFVFLFSKNTFLVFLPWTLSTPRLSLVIHGLNDFTEAGKCFLTSRKPNVRKDLLSLLLGCAYHSIIGHPSRQGFQNGSYDLLWHFTVPAISVHPAETTRLKIIQLSNNSIFWISAEQMVKYTPFIIN